MELKTYRGHIRNWESLCKELGIDTNLSREEREKEIILKGYEKWGYDIPDKLYGMFAFAIYDENKDELYCVRDQFGTKPFYYYLTESGKLLYGTLIKDFIDDPEFKKEINVSMLQIYMSLTYVAGKETFFKNVYKLMPGHYMIFKDGKINDVRYFKPTFNPDNNKSLEDFADEIHETVKEIFKEVIRLLYNPNNFKKENNCCCCPFFH